MGTLYKLKTKVEIINDYWSMDFEKSIDQEFDSSDEIWPDKEHAQAEIEIVENDSVIYRKTSPSSTILNTDESKFKEIRSSLRGLSCASLLPHIINGYNCDFIINGIINYTNDEEAMAFFK